MEGIEQEEQKVVLKNGTFTFGNNVKYLQLIKVYMALINFSVKHIFAQN